MQRLPILLNDNTISPFFVFFGFILFLRLSVSYNLGP